MVGAGFEVGGFDGGLDGELGGGFVVGLEGGLVGGFVGGSVGGFEGEVTGWLGGELVFAERVETSCAEQPSIPVRRIPEAKRTSGSQRKRFLGH